MKEKSPNPQIENGYTRIANEIMNELAKIKIPGQARQVLDYIFRKTYGWHKKTETISLSQFVEGTELSKVAVCKAINKLLSMNLVTKKGNAKSLFTKKGNDTNVTYSFQKDYTAWKPATLPKKETLPTLPKKETLRYQKGKSHVTKKGNTPIKDIRDKDNKRYAKEFLVFYEKYPIKKAKAKALESWIKLKKTNMLPELTILIESIEQQIKEKEIKISTNSFCPEWKHPTTWLNQKCWEDEVNLNIENKEFPAASYVDIYGED